MGCEYMNQSGTQDLGRKLFTVAAITDTHLNQGEQDCNSPFPVNQQANQRMRYVVQDLNQRQVDMVINLGDLLHPVPAVPDLYAAAASCFKQQVAELTAPLYCLPGNHDIGDKPNDWAPAAAICDNFIALWQAHFGAQFHSVEQGDCVFLLINAQLINSGLADEAKQASWLQAECKKHQAKRLFMFSHYPPYFSHAAEDDNYDNISEPGRSWLLNLLEEFKVEAFFAGHVHNFWYNRHAQTDCYLLPSTAFVRQDYSEMYRIAPQAGQEFGRNDHPKLGYMLVHVYEHGHVCELVRTYGEGLSPDQTILANTQDLPVVHPRLNQASRFGFDLRHNWMEIVEIPPTGGLDEFDRKEVRNDYPLLALWEMGVKHLRIPLRDLKLARNRQRLYDLQKHGMAFTLFSFAVPNAEEQALLCDNASLFNAWEVGYNASLLQQQANDLAAVFIRVQQAGLGQILLSKLRSGSDMRAETGRYYHVINQGFYAHEKAEIETLLAMPQWQGCVQGVVYRVNGLADESIIAQSQVVNNQAVELGIVGHVHVRLMGHNPAESQWQEEQTSDMLGQAILASAQCTHLTLFANTFEDNDRGYFVRQGVIDRLGNPRPALQLVKSLHGLLQNNWHIDELVICNQELGFIHSNIHYSLTIDSKGYSKLTPVKI